MTQTNGQPVSGEVTFTNESPNLITFQESSKTLRTGSQTGTAYLSASWGGYTTRVTIHIVETEDQIALSTLGLFMDMDMWCTTKLYVFDTSRFYGQDYTVEWSVDNPQVGRLETLVVDGYEAACLYPLKPGIATITCRVTLPDGTWAEGYCSVYVRSS